MTMPPYDPEALGPAIAAARAKFDPATARITMSLTESELLSVALAQASQTRWGGFDLVVGLANGALLPAKVVADTLGLPVQIVRIRRQGSGYKQKLIGIKNWLRIPNGLILWGPFKPLWDLFQNATSKLEEGHDAFGFDVAGKRVLLVDDCIVSGASVRHVAERLAACSAAEVRTAVICWCEDVPGGVPAPEPDVYLQRQIHTYPWAGNSDDLDAFKRWVSAHGLELWD
jgi:hypoxanthine phosphoribosyltransferase